MVLVDTSLWILVFRKDPLDLEARVEFESIVTCLPVIQEVLQGFQDESAFRAAREAMFSFPVLESPMSAGLFEEAAALYRAGRRAGLTIRSSWDCLIAACALRHDAEVAHRDRDFPALARVSPLKQRRL
jgi:predicted nucleic acid-binding protein